MQVTLDEFPRWLEMRLLAKFYLQMDRILVDVRPILLLARCIRKCAEEIAGALSKSPDYTAARQHTESTIHLMEALAFGFPLCPDLVYLQQFVFNLFKILEWLPIQLQPIERAVATSMSKQTRQAYSKILGALARLPQYVQQLALKIELHEILLRHISAVKREVSGVVECIYESQELQKMDLLQQECQSTKTTFVEYQQRMAEVEKDPCLIELRRAKSRAEELGTKMAAMLDSLSKASLKPKGTKKRAANSTAAPSSEQHVEVSVEASEITRYLSTLSSRGAAVFLHQLAASPPSAEPADFLRCLASFRSCATPVSTAKTAPAASTKPPSRDEMTLTISRKQYDVLTEAVRHVDAAVFENAFTEWRDTLRRLADIKNSVEYKKSARHFKEVATSLNAARAQHEVAVRGLQAVISRYQIAVCKFERVRKVATEVAAREFNVAIELVPPPGMLKLAAPPAEVALKTTA